jgi:hypothetical protein
MGIGTSPLTLIIDTAILLCNLSEFSYTNQIRQRFLTAGKPTCRGLKITFSRSQEKGPR